MAVTAILLETNPGMLDDLAAAFRRRAEVEVVRDVSALTRRLSRRVPDLVLLDYERNRSLIDSLRRRHPNLPLVAVLESGSIEHDQDAI